MKKHMASTFLHAGALLAIAVTVGNWAEAQTCSVAWTGNAGNGSWSTAGNWSPRKVPGATSDVCNAVLSVPSLTVDQDLTSREASTWVH